MHRLSSTQIRALLELAPALSCIADMETAHFTWLGPGWAELLGWSEAELQAHPIPHWLHPDDRQATLEANFRLREDDVVVDFVNRYRTQDGRWRHLSWHARARDGFVYAVATDVTQTHERARQAEEQNALLQMAEEMAEVGHWRVDLQSGQTVWSDQVFRIHGRDPTLGSPRLERVIGYTHTDDQERFRRAIADARTHGTSWRLELRRVRDDGQERTVISHGRAEHDAEGQVESLLVVCQDITDMRRLQLKLQEAERVSTITTLAAGIAHELNNPLQYLSANVALALESVMEVSSASKSVWATQQREYLQDAEHAVDQVARIVRDLRVFMRPVDRDTWTPVDLGAVLATTVSMTRSEVQQHAVVSRSLGQMPTVMGDQAEYIQVFVNLITNAADALRDLPTGEGRIRIQTWTDPGGRAVVTIEDNGPGIPAGILGRIFDPFFTTKDVGEGTGLGLHVSRNILRRRGGELEVESQPGRTVFRVTLPAAPTDGTSGPDRAELPTILVLDDDIRIARTIRRILDSEYRCTVESDPAVALRDLEAGRRYDFVLTDVNMPGLPGWDFIRRARLVWPDVDQHTVVMSGATLGRIPDDMADLVVLEKPFKVQELRDLLEDRQAWIGRA